MPDPRIIRFLNENGRPMAERLRNLYLQASALNADLALLIPLLPVDPEELIDDGRASEGVNQITSGEAQQAIAVLQAFIAFIEDPANADAFTVILKMCVRSARVESN